MPRPLRHDYTLAVFAAALAVLAGIDVELVRQPWVAALAFGVCVAAVAAIGRRVAARLLRDEPSVAVQLAAAGLVALSLAASIVTLTGWFGAFGHVAVFAILAVLHVLAVRLLPPPRPFAATLLPWDRGSGVFVVAAVAAMLIAWLFVARTQVTFTARDADSMWYHLPMAGEWVRNGSIWPIPSVPMIASAYPGFRQAVLAFLSLPFGNEHTALLGIVELPLLALAVYTLARAWGAVRGVALAIAFYGVTTPVVNGAFGTQGNDVLLAVLMLSSVLYLRRFFVNGTTGHAVLAGLALGGMCATKFSGPGYAAIAVVVALLEHGVRHVRPTRAAVALVGSAVVVAAPWYLRNLIAFGNPVHPAEVRIGDSVVFAGSLPNEYFTRHTLGWRVGPLLDNAHHFPEAHGWLIVILGLAPLGVLAAAFARRIGWRTALAAAALPLLLFVTFLHHPFNSPWFDAGYTHRYLIVWFVASCAVTAAALSRCGPQWPWIVLFVAGGLFDLTRATHWVPLFAGVVVAAAVVSLVPRARAAASRAAAVAATMHVPALVVVAVLAVAAYGVQRLRASLQFDEGVGYRDSASDRGWGPVMAWVHRNVHGQRVGLHGSIHFFPLLGDPFDNDVLLADDLHRPVTRRTVDEVAAWASEQRLDWLVCCVPRLSREGSREWTFGEAIAPLLVDGWPQRFSVAFASNGAAVLRVTPENGR